MDDFADATQADDRRSDKRRRSDVAFPIDAKRRTTIATFFCVARLRRFSATIACGKRTVGIVFLRRLPPWEGRWNCLVLPIREDDGIDDDFLHRFSASRLPP